ncbi:MAG: RIP metalloprotease RseP [Gammaproteobacteria bacterium]|nr:MAG: RIP metalloprotease RseP [Pseudomonadota bacterium]PIE39001.1 MAG: RIP metalloprotease RseP [Gammaproteobacteria bacterium]
MEVLQQIAALVITLGILVTVHEFGHFWVARRCGVKVLRFSVGFGKPLLVHRASSGTEFVIAAIPLGGYVKMLDEREGEVPEEELSLAFNRQPVKSRIAIAAAGPAFNFLFAILVYWFMFVVGFHVVAPVIGQVKEGSPADIAGLRSGMEIVALDGEETPSWQSVNMSLANRIGDTGDLRVDAVRFDSNADYRPVEKYTVRLENWMSGQEEPMPLDGIGVTPYRPSVQPVIGAISPGLAAEAAGLEPEDRILAIDGQDIASWDSFVALVRSSNGKKRVVTVQRGNSVLKLTLVPGARVLEDGQTIGFIGAAVKPVRWPDNFIRTVRLGVLEALPAGIARTWDDIALTFGAIKKIIVGAISVKSLSGPITIAKIAEESVSSGFENFLRFLAYLSVSLGVLNLLPIPVLDGGHLLYYFAEMVRGKPLPESVQVLGLKIGVAAILLLMVVAFYNDLSRL